LSLNKFTRRGNGKRGAVAGRTGRRRSKPSLSETLAVCRGEASPKKGKRRDRKLKTGEAVPRTARKNDSNEYVAVRSEVPSKEISQNKVHKKRKEAKTTLWDY